MVSFMYPSGTPADDRHSPCRLSVSKSPLPGSGSTNQCEGVLLTLWRMIVLKRDQYNKHDVLG